MKYVGIDVHKKMCQAAVLEEDGELLDQIRFANKKEDIKDFAARAAFRGMKANFVYNLT